MNCTVSRDKARSRSSSRLATSCIMRPSCCKIFYSSDDAGGPLLDNLDNAYRALTVQVHSLGEFVRYQSRAPDRWSSARCWRKQKSVSRSMSGVRRDRSSMHIGEVRSASTNPARSCDGRNQSLAGPRPGLIDFCPAWPAPKFDDAFATSIVSSAMVE